jgi:glutamyl-tRNA reductase
MILENVLSTHLTHKTARIVDLERFSWRDPATLLEETSSLPGVSECVVLKTCNRVESYVYAPLNDLDEPKEGLLTYFKGAELLEGEESLRHLMRVTGGLESMALGESQVQGQVKEAYDLSLKKGKCGKVLSLIFRRALSTGKRVRTETGVGKGAISMASLAVGFAEGSLGGLDGRRLLVIGAGATASLVAKALAKKKIDIVFVANRTRKNAERLASQLGGRAFGLDEIPRLLPLSDVTIVATSAPHFILTMDKVSGMEGDQKKEKEKEKKNRLIIDLGNPRNVDPEIGRLEHFKLVGLDDLGSLSFSNLDKRISETRRADEIIDEEVMKISVQLKAIEVDAVIKRLKEKSYLIQRQELSKAIKRLGPLGERELEIMGEFARSLANRLLEDPLHALKREAKKGDTELARRAEELFGLKERD